MKSPFPGMDPYIEERGLFEDFHDDLIGEIKAALSKVLPDRYVVRTSERPYVVISHTEEKEEHAFKPDVGVITPSPSPGFSNGGVAVAEPALEVDSVLMRAFIAREYQENFIEIYMVDPERILITCIEVLSPSNKRRDTPGWEIYLRKRQGLLLGEAHLVEMDLLRGGQRFPMLDPWPNSPYALLVARRERSPYCRVWPAHFRSPLPTIPIPLASPDPDVVLDLQPMVEAIYVRSRYARDIDYTRPLTRPLTTEESTWLTEQLRLQAR